jgi:hypothetical protein
MNFATFNDKLLNEEFLYVYINSRADKYWLYIRIERFFFFCTELKNFSVNKKLNIINFDMDSCYEYSIM